MDDSYIEQIVEINNKKGSRMKLNFLLHFARLINNKICT